LSILIDTHVHLANPIFDHDRDEILSHAEEAGIDGIVAVSETIEDARKNLGLSRQYPIVFPAAGLYPTYLDLMQAETMITLIRKNRDRLVAIGEVGLDYWKVKDDNDRNVQREIFCSFIDLALELDLPLNVHSRSAGRYALSFLIEHGAKRVQMHAFDGKAATALVGVEAGYYFSIPTSIVRSRQKQKLVKRLPLECLLLETDSPVLAPEPNQRNEPANLIFALKAVAEIKAVSEEQVCEVVTENFRRLYGNDIADFKGKVL